MKYPKILSIGDPLLKNLFEGEVNIEEKIDGSQFRVWFDSEGKIWFGSKAVNYNDENPIDKGFILAVSQAQKHFLNKEYKNMFFVFEYLVKRKQNTLMYLRTPKDNLILLDIMRDNTYLNYEDKCKISKELDFEVVPLLKSSEIKNVDEFKELLKIESCLGNCIIEGIVIKNYNQFHSLPYLLGMPVFGKYVREEFKELLKKEGVHRIIAVEPDQLVIKGDNNKAEEFINYSQVKGILVLTLYK